HYPGGCVRVPYCGACSGDRGSQQVGEADPLRMVSPHQLGAHLGLLARLRPEKTVCDLVSDLDDGRRQPLVTEGRDGRVGLLPDRPTKVGEVETPPLERLRLLTRIGPIVGQMQHDTDGETATSRFSGEGEGPSQVEGVPSAVQK